jgi:hypothetical protein
LALVVALSTGGAYAAATVRSQDIVDGQVKSSDLAGAAVTTAKLKQGAVTRAKLKQGAITAKEVANDSLTTAELAGDDYVTKLNFGLDQLSSGQCFLHDLFDPGAEQGQAVIATAAARYPADGMQIFGVGVLDDFITIAICNFSGGPVPDLDDFPVRILTFN